MKLSRRRALAALIALPALLPFARAAAPRPRILMVATNVGKVAGNTSGTFLMELALPFAYLHQQGYAIDIVTPKGGPAAIYHNGDVWDELRAARELPAFAAGVAATLTPQQVNAADYAAIYFPGGHGQYWDVFGNARIQQLTAAIHQQGGFISSAGHGTAALADVRLPDGRYLVAGKRMTCFPWWAEQKLMEISNYGKALPFDMEAVLRSRKAELVVPTEQTRRERSVSLITDEANRFVTATWASGARWVGEELHRLLSPRS